jgi:2-hydroxychromene-2-carboxylate isomerase
MTPVEFYVDPSCPWAWVTSRWVKEVAPARDLSLTWRSYCLEIRDDYDVAPTVPGHLREAALAGHALSHRMLRVFEAVRAAAGEDAVDALYTAWGARFFARGATRDDSLLTTCLDACGLDPALAGAADDEKWDGPITESMEVAYAFGGPKTQTPTIVVRDEPPHGFKGPVMAPAPTGEAAVRLWDAIQVVSREPAPPVGVRKAPAAGGAYGVRMPPRNSVRTRVRTCSRSVRSQRPGDAIHDRSMRAT